jgi:hypothetical protein
MSGFALSDGQVECVRRLARRNGLRDRIPVESMPFERLSCPDSFFDLAFGGSILQPSD